MSVMGRCCQIAQQSLLSFALLIFSGAMPAAENASGLSGEAEQERFRELTWELRCPKCQNQNLADSNAPVAADLRAEIVRLLQEGKENEQIVEYMVARYGEFVRYEPRARGINLLLWIVPALGLLIGAVVIAFRARNARNTQGDLLNARQREQVQQLLEEERATRARDSQK